MFAHSLGGWQACSVRARERVCVRLTMLERVIFSAVLNSRVDVRGLESTHTLTFFPSPYISGNLRSSSSMVLYALCLRRGKKSRPRQWMRLSFFLSGTYIHTWIIYTHFEKKGTYVEWEGHEENFEISLNYTILNASPASHWSWEPFWLHNRSTVSRFYNLSLRCSSITNSFCHQSLSKLLWDWRVVAETHLGSFVCYSPSQQLEGKLNSEPHYYSFSNVYNIYNINTNATIILWFIF